MWVTIMSAVSVRLPDEVLHVADQCADYMQINRAEYIRRAIETMNAEALARQRAQRLADVSYRVREESLRINAEFAAIEDAPDV
jgi:metal-responsive CopG/Arc/MetJ family transcriptional regulator